MGAWRKFKLGATTVTLGKSKPGPIWSTKVGYARIAGVYSDEMSEAKHTPGPWRWEINLKARRIQLCGGDPKSGFGAYDHTVMDFVRWGMNSAQPRFLDPGSSLLVEANHFAEMVKGREHHANWFQTISQANANMIAAAPDLFDALHALLAEKMSKPQDAPNYTPAERKAIDALLKAEGLPSADRPMVSQ